MEPEQKARTQVEPVGYGSPPVEHQFPNPKRQVGRKKGSKNKPKLPPGLTESERMALEEAKRLVGPPGSQIETACAVTRAQAKKGVQGGTNAQKAYLARLDSIQRKKKEAEDAQLAIWEEIVRLGEELLERASPEQRAELDRNLLPHPCDIDVDWQKRTVRISGPANIRERRICRQCVEHLETLRTSLMKMRLEIEAAPTDWNKQFLYYHMNEKFLNLWDLLPERMRPAPLLRWHPRKVLFWFESPEWKEKNKPKRRRLVKNAGLLPSPETRSKH